MSDTTDTAPEGGELTKPDGSPDWRRVREALAHERDQRQALEAAVDSERRARIEAEKARAAEAEQLGDLRAQVTFLRAGVNTDSGAGRTFAETYDGPLSADDVQRAYAAYLADATSAAHDFAAHLQRSANGDHRA